jgi:hypothetical protein
VTRAQGEERAGAIKTVDDWSKQLVKKLQFLATHSGHDKVEKMKIIVLPKKNSVAKATDLATRSNKNAKIGTEKFSASNKEIKSLKIRLQALEEMAGK